MDTEVKYGGFWIRQVAGLVDAVVIGVYYYVLLMFFRDDYYLTLNLYNIGWVLYYIFCLNSVWQGTIGMKVLDLKVVNRDMSKPNLAKVILRTVMFSLPMIPCMVFSYMGNIEEIMKKMEADTAAFAHDDAAMEKYMLDNPELLNYMLALAGQSVLLLILCSIWFLPMAFTKQKTGLHDLFSATRIIHTKPALPIQQ